MHYRQQLSNRILPLLRAMLCLAMAMRGDTSAEYQIKAGFLYNFTKFVTWPPEAFSSSDQSFTICTSGGKQVDQSLRETLKGKTVNERTVVTRSVHSEEDAKGCQVLFIPADSSRGESLLSDAKMPGVLTITDMSRDGKHGKYGAVITFVMDANRVRFVVDMKAAAKAGLTISSKLLSLALEVQH